MATQFFEYKSFTIGYKVTGTGAPLVLVHGFGEDGSVWVNQVAALQETTMLIVPDLPGSGESTVSTDDFTEERVALLSSIEFYADAIEALLQHLQINKCTIMGHSMGGYITLAFVEKYLGYVNGFGLIHSTSFADSDEKKTGRLKGIDIMERHTGYGFLKTSIPNLFGSKFKEQYPEKVAALVEKAKAFETKALQCYYKAMWARPGREHVLKNSKLPVLMVAGGKDIVVPLNDSLQQAHIPDVCHIHILEEAAHMGMWEATEEVNEFIKGYLRELA